MYPILISLCFGINPSCWQFENLKHLRNLKKWHKFIKRSQILLRFEYNIHWGLKPYWTLSAVWIGRLIKTEQIDGTYKDGLQKYFQHKKERHMPWIILIYYLEFIMFATLWLTVIDLHIDVWSGLEAFWSISKREGEGTVILK